MPPKPSKHRLRAQPTQPTLRTAPQENLRSAATERMLEKRSLNDPKLGTALDVILDGLDKVAGVRGRGDFGFTKRQWEEVYNLAQALGLPKDEAIARSVNSSLRNELANIRTRINQYNVDFETVQLEGVDATSDGADEEFKRRVVAHEKRRAKMAKLMKKKAQS